jgi:hypothetical protein
MKQLPDRPAFTFDMVRAAFQRALGNRFKMPSDEAIHEVYHAMVGWYPWIVAAQRDQERTRPERELIDKANRLRTEYIEALQQLRQIREAQAAAEAERRPDNPYHPDPLASLPVREIDQHLELTNAMVAVHQPHDLRRLWHWVWEVWPPEIEAAIRSANPSFPYPATRGEGRVERGPSIVAQIMADLIQDFTGDDGQTAGAIERKLQRLRAEEERLRPHDEDAADNPRAGEDFSPPSL